MHLYLSLSSNDFGVEIGHSDEAIGEAPRAHKDAMAGHSVIKDVGTIVPP